MNEASEAKRLYKGYFKQYGENKISREKFNKKKDKLKLPRYRKLNQRIGYIRNLEKQISTVEPEKQRELERKVTELKKEVIDMYKKMD